MKLKLFSQKQSAKTSESGKEKLTPSQLENLDIVENKLLSTDIKTVNAVTLDEITNEIKKQFENKDDLFNYINGVLSKFNNKHAKLTIIREPSELSELSENDKKNFKKLTTSFKDSVASLDIINTMLYLTILKMTFGEDAIYRLLKKTSYYLNRATSQQALFQYLESLNKFFPLTLDAIDESLYGILMSDFPQFANVLLNQTLEKYPDFQFISSSNNYDDSEPTWQLRSLYLNSHPDAAEEYVKFIPFLSPSTFFGKDFQFSGHGAFIEAIAQQDNVEMLPYINTRIAMDYVFQWDSAKCLKKSSLISPEIKNLMRNSSLC